MILKTLMGAFLSLGLTLGAGNAIAAQERTKTVHQKQVKQPSVKKVSKNIDKKNVKRVQNKKQERKVAQTKNNSTRNLALRSESPALAPKNIKYTVFNYENGQVFESNGESIAWPIASLTKLMTAYVFVDNVPDLHNCTATITDEDMDLLKSTHTRLSFYTPYACETLLKVMLVASDNYAASALARSIPGWDKPTFVKQMNLQAKKWGLNNTRFVDSSGLSPENHSSVDDYRKLTMNVVKNSTISSYSSSHQVVTENKWHKQITYKNSNKLVRDYGFDVNLSKTGFIRESGYNLVHLADCAQPIGVIQFGARSSEQRASFTKQKLSKYGCS